MNPILFIILITLFCFIGSFNIIKEFEETEIVNNTQILIFNNHYDEELDYYPEILINCLNPYKIKHITSKLVISKTIKRQYTLEGEETIVISRNDEINEGNGDYILIFKNFIGGKIIIFNVMHSFPLKNFPNLIYLWSDKKIDSNFQILLQSDLLEEDVYLTFKGRIYNITLEKINDTKTEEINLDYNVKKLDKGYYYRFTYNVTDFFSFSIKKRVIKIYDKLKYEKYYILYNDPVFYLVNLEEYNNSIKDLYFFVYQDNYYISNPSISLELAEVDEYVKEGDLDSIKFTQKKTLNREIISTKFNESLINTNYILIKIITNYYTYSYFHIFEDSIEVSRYQTIIFKPKKETLITIPCEYKFTIIISNNTNIKSLENFKNNYYDIKYISTDYPRGEKLFVNVLPTEDTTLITMFSENIIQKNIIKDFSFQNFLYPYYTHIEDKYTVWFFYNNKNSKIKIKKHFGNPKIFYSKNLENLKTFSKDNSVLNKIEDEVEIKDFFYIYIYPYENTFIDFMVNEIEDNEDIIFNDDDNVLKFLKKDVVYNLVDIDIINVRIERNEKLNKSINIIDSNKIKKYILNKDNSYIDLDKSFKDLRIYSEEDTYIKIYHNISDVFCSEKIYTIEIKREDYEKGLIINITNIKEITLFHYSLFYGYKDLVPSNLVQLHYSEQYLYINNEFEKFDFLNEDKNLYIYIYGTNAIYSIHYINTYKLNPKSFYTKITPKENYYFLAEKNYNHFYYADYSYSFSFVELYFCRKDMKINPMYVKMFNLEGKEHNEIITTDSYITFGFTKTMWQFNYSSEFILISHENYDRPDLNNIEFYIPEVNNSYISLLIKSIKNTEDINYTIIIVEENNDGDELIDKLNNPCYFFQILEKGPNLLSEYNNKIIYASSRKDYFIYEEINISQFTQNKKLYIKILSYSEKFKTIFYSKTKIIYLENIIQNDNNKNENDFGFNYIEDNKEYTITNDNYIFKYSIKRNYLNIMPVIFLKYYITYEPSYLDKEIEIINPLLQNVTNNLGSSGELTLSVNNILKEYGDYYIIFRNCLGVKFYIHNTINIFTLNDNTPHYLSYSSNNATDSILYLSLNLTKEKYIYLQSYCYLYFYSKNEKKIIDKFRTNTLGYNKYNPNDYLIFTNYEECLFNSHSLAVISDRYLEREEIPLSKEISSVEFDNIYFSNTKHLIIDLNIYKIKPYIIVGNPRNHLYYCSKYNNIDDIVDNQGMIQYSFLDTNHHIVNLTSIYCSNDAPYIVIIFSNTIFELITDYRIVIENKDITISPSKETIVFDIRVPNNKINYIFAFSSKENLQDLKKTKNDNTKIIFDKSNYYQFKLNPNEETELNIRMYESNEIMEINYIKENELSDLIISEYNNINIKYYINLLKKSVIYYHYDLFGETEIYLLRDEIELNTTIIEKIFVSNTIPDDIFSAKNSSNITINPYQILAVKINTNKLVQYLYMSSLRQDFTIFKPIKYIKANQKYLLKKNVKIFLDNKSQASIKLSSYDGNLIYIINKTDNSFENFGENLILESDKDTFIYLFYKKNKDSELSITIFKRDYPINKILFFENVEGDIYYDYTFDKYYQSTINLNKIIINDNNIRIYYPYNNKKLLDLEYYIYSNKKGEFYTLDNLNYGYNLLKINDKYISQIIFNNNETKFNFYYQYLTCGNSTDFNQELYIFYNNNYKRKLEYTEGEIILESMGNEIYFLYNIQKESFFNFYFTSEFFDNDYKNNNPDFYIYFGTRNEIIIEILPIYYYKELDYYFIYIIKTNEQNEILNLLNNIWYVKEIIDNNSININITKKTLSGYYYQNVSISTSEKLEDNYTIYINILANGFILDGLNTTLTYKAKSHTINHSDFQDITINPDTEPGDEETNTTVLALIISFSIIFGIIIILLIFFFYRKMNRNKRIKNENEIYKENSGEIMLKSETDKY